jgi:hypothetical protein
VADFNNDSETDILLFNPATFDISVWLLTDGVFTGGGFVGAPPDWTPVAAGDFDGDGDLDLLLYNTVTSQYAVWVLENLAIQSGTGDALTGYTFVETTASVDGNNTDDIAIRETSTGNIYWWLVGFPGGNFAITGVTFAGGAGSNLPVGLGEFNGDDDTDILFQNATNGDVSLWTLTAGAFSGGGFVGGPLINPPAIDFSVVNNGQ